MPLVSKQFKQHVSFPGKHLHIAQDPVRNVWDDKHKQLQMDDKVPARPLAVAALVDRHNKERMCLPGRAVTFLIAVCNELASSRHVVPKRTSVGVLHYLFLEGGAVCSIASANRGVYTMPDPCRNGNDRGGPRCTPCRVGWTVLGASCRWGRGLPRSSFPCTSLP